jgi:hypothetical protein
VVKISQILSILEAVSMLINRLDIGYEKNKGVKDDQGLGQEELV